MRRRWTCIWRVTKSILSSLPLSSSSSLEFSSITTQQSIVQKIWSSDSYPSHHCITVLFTSFNTFPWFLAWHCAKSRSSAWSILPVQLGRTSLTASLPQYLKNWLPIPNLLFLPTTHFGGGNLFFTNHISDTNRIKFYTLFQNYFCMQGTSNPICMLLNKHLNRWQHWQKTFEGLSNFGCSALWWLIVDCQQPEDFSSKPGGIWTVQKNFFLPIICYLLLNKHT